MIKDIETAELIAYKKSKLPTKTQLDTLNLTLHLVVEDIKFFREELEIIKLRLNNLERKK